MREEKPRILVGLTNDLACRDLIDTGALDVLANSCEVLWFADTSVKRSLPKELGANFVGYSRTDPKYQEWRLKMFWLSVFAGSRRSPTLAVRRKYKDFTRAGRAFYAVFGAPVIWRLVNALVEAFIPTNQQMEKIIARVGPQAVIFPSRGNDPFALDIMRITRARRIVSVMLACNWDNMTSKGIMRIKPDALCLWGDDMRRSVEHLHRIPSSRIEVIGAPQFQPHFNMVAGRGAANDPVEKPIVIFAGNSRGHAEAKYLIALEQAIDSGRLPPAKIVYRPHPWRAARAGERDFHEFGFKHIVMDAQLREYFGAGMNAAGRGADKTFAPPIAYNAQILGAAKAVVTPLSTFGLEAAIVGVPILALDCFEEEMLQHALKRFEHLQRMSADFPGVVVCEDESGFVDKVSQLLELSDDPALPARMREASKPIVCSDKNTTYAMRLARVVGRLVGFQADEVYAGQLGAQKVGL